MSFTVMMERLKKLTLASTFCNHVYIKQNFCTDWVLYCLTRMCTMSDYHKTETLHCSHNANLIVAQSAKRILIALSNNQIWLIVTHDCLRLLPCKYTRSSSHVGVCFDYILDFYLTHKSSYESLNMCNYKTPFRRLGHN